jgi:hypothetical protein
MLLDHLRQKNRKADKKRKLEETQEWRRTNKIDLYA